MCGRAAQTQSAVYAAASALQVRIPLAECNNGDGMKSPGMADCDSHVNAVCDAGPQAIEQNSAHAHTSDLDYGESLSSISPKEYEWKDNFNMSPGMDAMVFFKAASGKKDVQMERKIWGLISRGGTRQKPLPTGMNQHFQALMFNARSDTLYEKATFSRLASTGRSCLVALDGFFEWKEPALKGEKKQPYFVYRKNKDAPYLLLPGLWTSVPTGRDDSPVLDTFTVITTEVCKPLEWLHTRMPICIWNEELALQWLEHPSEAVHRKMEIESKQTTEEMFGWHAVSTEMSSTKFRGAEALKPLPRLKTVKSFFSAVSSSPHANAQKAFSSISCLKQESSETLDNKNKNPIQQTTTSPSSLSLKRTIQSSNQSLPTKARKIGAVPSKGALSDKSKESSGKGTITSFFAPKKK